MLEAISSLSSFVDRAGSVSNSQLNTVQKTAAASVAGSQGGFGDVMAQIAANATETLKAGEATAIMGMQGKASVQQVVEAVMSAEQTLQTAIAIRDKVVAAYQEISRMSI
jgi:flagellar hook-basal body complex protein FliE